MSSILADQRMTSYDNPPITGTNAMRIRRSPTVSGLPSSANTKMETSITKNRKLVPQRGCRRGRLREFSTVMGTSAS